MKQVNEKIGYVDPEQFNFKYVVSTLRESYSATRNGWKALMYNGESFYESKHYDINPIIDRVGGGDSFASGLIYGLMTTENAENGCLGTICPQAIMMSVFFYSLING